MPRQARFVVPGHVHHVTQRGNYRQKIFYENQDYAVYLKYIQKYAKKFAVSIYAFCLMYNHVHWIVKPHLKESLSRLFSVAHQRYAYYLHKRMDKKGHLWQARFYSCVCIDHHIEQAIRYVERNPVRAKIVNQPWEYVWSSAKAHMGKTYRLIELADINEYIKVNSWKDFLIPTERSEELKFIRDATQQGKFLGPAKRIPLFEEKFKRKLVILRRGRPSLF